MITLILAAALALQPPAPPKPDEVCLTNACGPAPALIATNAVVRNESAIAAALRAGDMAGLVRAGGTATEGVQLLREACARSGEPGCDQLPKPGTERWGINTLGEVTIGGEVEPRTIIGPDGAPRSGGTFMTRRLAGVEPRPDMPRPRPVDASFAATPITERAVQPDGRVIQVVTGWRQPDGRITPTPRP